MGSSPTRSSSSFFGLTSLHFHSCLMKIYSPLIHNSTALHVLIPCVVRYFAACASRNVRLLFTYASCKCVVSLQCSSVDIARCSVGSLQCSSVDIAHYSVGSLQCSSVDIAHYSVGSLQCSSVDIARCSVGSLQCSSVDIAHYSVGSLQCRVPSVQGPFSAALLILLIVV